jgi:hypothetical protein
MMSNRKSRSWLRKVRKSTSQTSLVLRPSLLSLNHTDLNFGCFHLPVSRIALYLSQSREIIRLPEKLLGKSVLELNIVFILSHQKMHFLQRILTPLSKTLSHIIPKNKNT